MSWCSLNNRKLADHYSTEFSNEYQASTSPLFSSHNTLCYCCCGSALFAAYHNDLHDIMSYDEAWYRRRVVWCCLRKKCSLGGIRVSLWSLNRKRLRWELWAVQVFSHFHIFLFRTILGNHWFTILLCRVPNVYCILDTNVWHLAMNPRSRECKHRAKVY